MKKITLTGLVFYHPCFMSSKLSSKGIFIFLTVDSQTIGDYKRHLSQKFEQYIMSTCIASKRYTVIKYKFIYKTALDEQYVEPLTMAIRKHFSEKIEIKEAEFEKFKKRGWFVLVLSMGIMMACKTIESVLRSKGVEIQNTVRNGMDIFNWVILWRPIDTLIFNWNPYLKEICLLNKLKNAEVVRIACEQ
jgi:hypothetical protein